MSISHIEPQVLPEFLAAHSDAILLDVRATWEHEVGAIPGALLIPFGELHARAENELPNKDASIIVYCHHGIRSLHACEFLSSLGYSDLINLIGGIDRYSVEVDSSIPAY